MKKVFGEEISKKGRKTKFSKLTGGEGGGRGQKKGGGTKIFWKKCRGGGEQPRRASNISSRLKLWQNQDAISSQFQCFSGNYKTIQHANKLCHRMFFFKKVYKC